MRKLDAQILADALKNDKEFEHIVHECEWNNDYILGYEERIIHNTGSWGDQLGGKGLILSEDNEEMVRVGHEIITINYDAQMKRLTAKQRKNERKRQSYRNRHKR